MTDKIFRPFALDVYTDAEAAFEIAEALGLLEESPALSVSLFEAEGANMQVQALYDTKHQAEGAQAALSLSGEVYQLPETDWVSKTQSGLAPVRAGRFFVHGSHDSDKIPPDAKYPILIEAGMAFGTGHHGTTKGCLLILDELTSDGFNPNSVLDLGCGAGILAIAVAKVFPKIHILASDIDPEAVSVTLENAIINETADNLKAFEADGFSSPQLKGKSFELIFANILAGPLMALAPDIYTATSLGGYVILSGILTEQAETVTQTFEAIGFTVEPRVTLDAWTSLLAKKPN